MSARTSGGSRLESCLSTLVRRVNEANTVDVGFLSDATYPDGKPVAYVAAIQEFGAPSQNIPARPFFRTMIAKDGKAWGGELAAILKANDYSAATALDAMGQHVAGQLKESIRETNDPPLAPSTIAKKGFSTPLIDTGHMLNSVDSKVHES